jgi:hypothetical protein
VPLKKRAISPDGSNLERRKSQRFQVPIPIEASWRGPSGRAVKEAAVGRQVNAQGALLKMASYPAIGSRVTLTNFFSAKTAEARVLGTPYAREGVSHGIAVELIVPSESFWGVSLQVKKAGLELAKLEKCLQSEGIDLRLLREYQDSVNWVRMSAQVVRELRERQLDGRDDSDIVETLTTARIQRAKNLSLELIADLDAARVGSETRGIEELHHALDQACGRLRSLPSRGVPKGV